MVNRDNTLTVEWLLKAVADGRVRTDMPIGVIFAGLSTVHGVDSFEVHTYKDGTKVFVMHTEVSRRAVADEPGEDRAEVGL
jgi:hypothetical protein